MSDDKTLSAGSFSVWLAETRRALDGAANADVPCNGCTACCRAAQFVHIGADEIETLARVPRELQFPAPGGAAGDVVLGYDERGHCPMLVDDACSIYEHRPRACRMYDCRVFAATGVTPAEPVAVRVRRWRFDYASDGDRVAHDALRAGAAALTASNPTEQAVVAVRAHLSGRSPSG